MANVPLDYSLKFYITFDPELGLTFVQPLLYPYYHTQLQMYDGLPYMVGNFEFPSSTYPTLESFIPVAIASPGPQWLVDQFNAFMNPTLDPLFPISVVGTFQGVDSEIKPFVADKVHSHVISDVTGLQSALNSKQPNITTGTSSQYLKGNLTLGTFPTTMDSFTDGTNNKVFSSSDKTKLDGLSNPLPLSFSTGITFSNATTANKLSTTRNAFVSYEFDANVPFSLLGGSSITATLTYADNSAMTTNPVVLKTVKSANTGLVTGAAQTNTLTVFGFVPADKYRRVTFSVTGNATSPSTIASSQEVLI